MTLDYVKQRILRRDREKFEKVLAPINAANIPPDDADRLPEGSEVRLPLR